MSVNGPDDETVVVFPKNFKLPKLPGGDGLRWILLAFVAFLVLSSTVYTIEPEEVGVVTRFGEYVRIGESGLNMKAPLGIERVIKVPVERQLKEEFGFRTLSSGVRSEFTSQGHEDESSMLTGDLNIAVVEWVVQYRIEDPYRYLFKVRNVTDTLRDMSEAVMRLVVGDRTVDEVLTIGRQEVADLMQQRLQEMCSQYDTGIKIEQVVLQDVTPPAPVRPAFNQVNEAEQERETLISQAQSEYNKVVFRARGLADRTVEMAEGYAIDRVNRAKGEASRFESLYGEYAKAPEVTRKRIYLETMSKVLPKVGQTIVVDEDVKSVLPLLNLQRATGGGGE